MSKASETINRSVWIWNAILRFDAVRNLIRLEMEPTDQQFPLWIMNGGPVSFPGDEVSAPTGKPANDRTLTIARLT